MEERFSTPNQEPLPAAMQEIVTYEGGASALRFSGEGEVRGKYFDPNKPEEMNMILQTPEGRFGFGRGYVLDTAGGTHYRLAKKGDTPPLVLGEDEEWHISVIGESGEGTTLAIKSPELALVKYKNHFNEGNENSGESPFDSLDKAILMIDEAAHRGE